jgi:hypothetical protein
MLTQAIVASAFTAARSTLAGAQVQLQDASTGVQIVGTSTAPMIEQAVTLYGESQKYAGSVRVLLSEFTGAMPAAGDVLKVQDRFNAQDPSRMVDRRILGVRPDQTGATALIDYGALYADGR